MMEMWTLSAATKTPFRRLGEADGLEKPNKGSGEVGFKL